VTGVLGGPWGELEPAWPCEAYGAEGLEVGAVCFVGDVGRRVCGSAVECRVVLAGCREQLAARLQELAAGGDLRPGDRVPYPCPEGCGCMVGFTPDPDCGCDGPCTDANPLVLI
jgi:hypothetical protein